MSVVPQSARSRGLGLVGALVLDRVAGQPRAHPVRAIGALLGGARRLRRSRTPAGSLVEGAAVLAAVSGIAAAVAHLLGPRPRRRSPDVARSSLPATLMAAGSEALLLHPALALEALAEAGERVGAALRAGDLDAARRRLAWDLVSRDTGALDESLCAALAPAPLARLENSLARIGARREALSTEVARRGWRPLPSATGFVLAAVSGASATAHELRLRGVRVRHAASFGLPGHIRVSVRRRAEENRFLSALDGMAAPTTTTGGLS